jgi:hypothetical protein
MGENRYLEEFFSLKCAGDVINAVTPLTRATKEITEAMGVVRHLKSFFLQHPMERKLVDLAAGNALTAIIAAHLLPVKQSVAVDKNPRLRAGYAKVDRFMYENMDIADLVGAEWTSDIVFSSVHPCSDLATRIVDLYLATPCAVGLVLMPCCNGHQNDKKIPTAFRQRISKYEAWAWWLAERAKGDLFVDRNVLSPCNAIVVAKKGKE